MSSIVAMGSLLCFANPSPETRVRFGSYPKWFGGSSSCLAVIVSHPLDLVKVRLQAAPLAGRKTFVDTVIQISRLEGLQGLYRGLSASLLRQLTYGSTRFAIYESIKEKSVSRNNGPASMAVLLPASVFSGVCGAIVGNPADICNVRMQNDNSLPPNQRQNYRNVLDALIRIRRQDGLSGFFRGVFPSSVRAGAATGCQLGSYDVIKQALIANASLKDGPPTQLLASLLASIVATTICSPMDVIKTRMMSETGGTSAWGMITQLTRSEGWRWIFRGWVPSFTRLGPHTAATLLILEQHRKFYNIYTVQ
ncbi:mitochondrial carrier domain-containing protein [Mariannaea sp. PMI_226]|nr:mitochondrial carrier domain-containing protein [Mariannaea sp. PMI_226]